MPNFLQNIFDKLQQSLDRVVLRDFDNPDAMVAALERGEIDAAEDLPGTAFLQLKKDPNIVTVEGNQGAMNEFAINGGDGLKKPHPALADLRVRQAIAHAIDKKALVARPMGGIGTPADALSPSANPEWTPKIPKSQLYDFNLDKAKKMAEQAQAKLDEAQQQFNSSQQAGQSTSGPVVEYDKHGRPIAQESPASASPPHGDPPAKQPTHQDAKVLVHPASEHARQPRTHQPPELKRITAQDRAIASEHDNQIGPERGEIETVSVIDGDDLHRRLPLQKLVELLPGILDPPDFEIGDDNQPQWRSSHWSGNIRIPNSQV
jgi:hypothetical protein